MKTKGSMLGGVLLIGGTCIGAGMLGLPVMTAAAGFYPTMGAFLFVWFFMTLSAFAYLEVSMRFSGDVNLITMVDTTLGSVAKWSAWLIYVLFLYALMAAYTAGGTAIFSNILNLHSEFNLHPVMISLLFIIPFATIVYLGTAWVDKVNRVLMFGFIATFLTLCTTFISGTKDNISHFNAVGDAKYLLYTLPFLVTCFGYHTLIPTLKTYLNGSLKKLKITILLGGLSPLIVYAAWELIILYLIPTWGDGGLVSILHHNNSNPAEAMVKILSVNNNAIRIIISWFSYFALTSSFIGVGLGMRDFFSDGLHIRKTKKGRLLLASLTFGPPFIYAMLYPQGFLFALKYAGICAAILLIIFPSVMAWCARFEKISGRYNMWGGKPLLFLTILFGLFIVFADVLQRMNLLPIP